MSPVSNVTPTPAPGRTAFEAATAPSSRSRRPCHRQLDEWPITHRKRRDWPLLHRVDAQSAGNLPLDEEEVRNRPLGGGRDAGLLEGHTTPEAACDD
ncbi:MAG: hypothetical protein LBE67_03695 [Kocuria palustris]|nr:hypothetical protein [Kocuria palustris]